MDQKIQIELDNIATLCTSILGDATWSGNSCKAMMKRNDEFFTLVVNDRMSLDMDDVAIEFRSSQIDVLVNGSVAGTETKIDAANCMVGLSSEVHVSSFENQFWSNTEGYFRSYRKTKRRHLIFQLYGNSHLRIRVGYCTIEVYNVRDYIIVESVSERVTFDIFSEAAYNVMVALGFITGHFVQHEEFVFKSVSSQDDDNNCAVKYRKLRPGFSSNYQAIATNPYHHIAILSDSLPIDHTFRYMSAETVEELVNLVANESQIKYAFVLFIEASGIGQSLLIKNNCLFAVLEVLKKYFFKVFKDALPGNYSSLGNVAKYKTLFSQLFPVSSLEVDTIEKRNVFLHGDIESITGDEMVSLMDRQITLIYKLVLSYVKFDGYIIDYEALRRNPTINCFVKLNC